MSKANLPWYKRNPEDWRRGTRRHAMSIELRGFYSECLDAMWELQDALPKDDKILSILLAVSPRLVRALMPKLIALGKIVETESGYFNPRMLADIQGRPVAAPEPTRAPVEPESSASRAPVEPESSASRAPVERQSRTKVPKNPVFSTRDLEEDLEKEREVQNPPNPQTGERDDMPKHVKAVQNWGSVFAPPAPEPQVGLIGDRLELAGETQSRWLALFPDAAALDLALIEVRGQVQPHSRSHSLAAQVESHLARIVRDRAERDRRYREATAASASRRPTASAVPGKRTMADALRDFEAAGVAS